MSYKTEEFLKRYEERLNKIKAFESVIVESDGSDEIKKFVEEEIKNFCLKKINELDADKFVDDDESKERPTLTDDEIVLLKSVAARLANKPDLPLNQNNTDNQNNQSSYSSNMPTQSFSRSKTDRKFAILKSTGEKVQLMSSFMHDGSVSIKVGDNKRIVMQDDLELDSI